MRARIVHAAGVNERQARAKEKTAPEWTCSSFRGYIGAEVEVYEGAGVKFSWNEATTDHLPHNKRSCCVL